MTGGRLLRRSIGRHRRRMAAAVILLAGHQAAEALVPVMIGVIIDRAVGTGDTLALLLWVLVLAALFTALTLCWRHGARHGVIAMEREMHQLRMEVVTRVLDPRGHRTGLRTGEVLQVATSDAEKAAAVMHAVSMAAAATTGLAVSAVSLLTIDVPLGITVLVGVPVLVAGLHLLSPLLTRRAAAAQAAAGETTALATDLVRGVRALRGIGAQASAADAYRTSSRTALRASLRAATTTGVQQGLTAAVSGLFLAAVAGFAGWLALDGRITIGELITVVGLAQFIAEPVRVLGFAGPILARARASADRLVRVLTAPPVVAPGTRTALPDTGVTLHDVGYRTLADLNLDLAPGETVGVVGYDQRDCDALLELLAGTVPAGDYRGSVSVGGVPLAELDLAASRGMVLVEQHDVALFEGTLRSNLNAGTEHPAHTVEAALAAAAAEDIVAAHPDGLDHPVTDRGSTLSGGQRQRLGLARALATGPPVLVLHEPTTAVDAVTEERIARGIAQLRGSACTLLVTASPALLAVADRVLVLDGGRITAAGTHAELSEVDERYREAVLR
ncbi:ABC transporter [Actinophytocola xinjiangensis]|uniref:ABC transporter n=1 Tax=Actinophytocola xinjiangensis TaxID=485602 RepID=A0A7Z1B1A1_9PSEU|nr:ABC transporter [Actinophytocola xinjiangensis]